MKNRLFYIIICFLFFTHFSQAAEPVNYLAYAEKIANSEMQTPSTSVINWNYKQALLNNAYLKLYEATQIETYYNYVKKSADNMLDERGTINGYNQEAFNLQDICGGNFLYGIYYNNRGGSKYLNAMILLRKQLHRQPRTQDRAFVFSKANAHEVRLDGLYMALPFYCLYASILDEPKVFGDIVAQFSIVDDITLDKETGLNYQAWDEKKTRDWADKTTGTTTVFFGQSIGFYMMALVDVLDYFPLDHPYRNEIIRKLNRITAALVKHQESKTGMWYQVVNKPRASKNFMESSSTAMYTYAIAKGVNNGYLPKKYRKNAEKAFKGLINNCIDYNTNCITKATGDANPAYGDGTFNFYTDLPQKTQEPNATAAFILAAVELAK